MDDHQIGERVDETAVLVGNNIQHAPVLDRDQEHGALRVGQGDFCGHRTLANPTSALDGDRETGWNLFVGSNDPVGDRFSEKGSERCRIEFRRFSVTEEKACFQSHREDEVSTNQ